ncbi:ARMT1-like domain-containing protein [uncultured Thomasclavelia sp.]|uniref:damage-control phosphatase ARMT1 family protein n=1 Tax=uncultured Thomasclavelia sp. TaxID=3025759 RepID=UPI00261C1768|nr:ARMT1-like domain-containing protein [uncultured Thomasclavelia sp.]
MKINEKCLPCLINQVVKVANITNCSNCDDLYHQVFEQLSKIDFNKSNPEIIGMIFELVKKHLNNEDPYQEIRQYYNNLFLQSYDDFDKKINSFKTAIKYAIIGNIIDFSPINNQEITKIDDWFDNIDNLSLTIDHVDKLINDIKKAKTILYLGDNCGEICLDKLLLKRIKQLNPSLKIYFGVRGKPVVNDSIESDAYEVGIDEYASIISNGDNSLGTILSRTSAQFNQIYQNCDFVIAKGQANFESLSEENKKIYFLLMVKCGVIAKYINVPEKSLVCYCK